MTLAELLTHATTMLGMARHVAIQYTRKHPWAVAVMVYGVVRAFGVTIQSGQRGVLFRGGRAVRELEPGFHWLVPVIDAVKKTLVRSVTIDLPGQKVMTADGLVYEVGVNVVYRVEDATRALTFVDHVDAGCRSAIPILVNEVLRGREQGELVDRVALDGELSARMNAWVARWGLVVEQAGFTTIAPGEGALQVTQLRSRTMERGRALRTLIAGGLDAESAMILLGTGRRMVAKSGRRGHRRGRTGVARRLEM